jgi:hypothetical protein
MKTCIINNTRKPLFQKQHYDVIGQLIGQKIVYGIMDDKDYTIIEAFAEMFAEDIIQRCLTKASLEMMQCK